MIWLGRNEEGQFKIGYHSWGQDSRCHLSRYLAMSQPLLYKYRSLDNWKFLLDILINKRLHAARFQDLNDPMEGRYYYEDEVISLEFRRAI